VGQQELQKRLYELGVDIPKSTIQRWASEGLIQGPTIYRDKKKKLGEKGQRGRRSRWENSLEDIVAVYALRHFRLPWISDYNWRGGLQKEKNRMPNTIIEEVKREARRLHRLLREDYKEAWRLREDLRSNKTLFFNREHLLPLVVFWILAAEKARNSVVIDQHLCIRYDWVVQESGRIEFVGTKLSDRASVIVLKIKHLKPHSGYAKGSRYWPDATLVTSENGFYESEERDTTEFVSLYPTLHPRQLLDYVHPGELSLAESYAGEYDDW
jgi:hypothetical protein